MFQIIDKCFTIIFKGIMEIEKKKTHNLYSSTLPSFRMTNNPLTWTNLINKRQPISIKPPKIQFTDIEANHKYEIQLYIRNQSREKQKIRIIEPTSEYFSVICHTNPIHIAPGLTQKIKVFFQLKVTANTNTNPEKDIYEDRLIILGNEFKKEVPLISIRTDFKIKIPDLFRLGVLKINEEKEYGIDIQNYGDSDIQIGMIECSSSKLSFDKEKIIAKKLGITQLKVRVRSDELGPIQETIYFPNGHKMKIKGICTEDRIQIMNQRGARYSLRDFGLVFIGEKICEQFYIVNSSPADIECLIKIFSRGIPDYIDIKVDQAKKTFVSRQKPTKLTQQDKKVNVRCQNSKFVVKAFSELQNTLTLQRVPTEQELDAFKKETFIEQSKNTQAIKSYNQILETLYLKIMDIDKPIKIPLKFTPIVPKIFIDTNKFEFGTIPPKKYSIQEFHIKNENEKSLEISFPTRGIFFVEGNERIESGETGIYRLIFRPLIYGNYSQNIKISLFDVWSVDLRVFGSCMKQDLQSTQKNVKAMPKLHSQRVLKQNSLNINFLASERKKRKEKLFTSLLKTKFSEKMKNTLQSQDIPIDLQFDAHQNPKLHDRKFTIKPPISQLYLQKERGSQKNMSKSGNSQIKCNDMNKLTEELTIAELGKIEVKNDEIDFGNIFIGSKNEKSLVIHNKNHKPILVEVILGDHQCFSHSKKYDMKKIDGFSETKFSIALKPLQLGSLRLPISYTINKHHVFEIDVLANVTLLNLGFSSKSLEFSFRPNQCEFQKIQTIQVANYGNTATRFVIIEPSNKNFSIVSPIEEQISPNSEVPILVKFQPVESSQKGEEATHIDKLIVKVIGGAQNIIRLKGIVNEPKFSLKETQIVYPEIFVYTKAIGKLTVRNHSKVETAVKIQMTPPWLNEIIIMDQKKLMMHAEQRKQISFELLSSQVKQVKGHFIVTVRGGKLFKIPIFINFCFPTVDLIGQNRESDLDLGIVHILSNHIEKEIKVINRMKSEIKLQINKYYSQLDYTLEILTTNQTVEFALDKENQSNNEKVIIKQMSHSGDKAGFQNSKGMQNAQKLAKILTLYPGVQTNFIIKFIPKTVKEYCFNLPLFLHKATKDIRPIKQKIKCCAVQPLFYVNPYHLHFDNVILSESQMGSCKIIEIVNPRNDEIYWELESLPPNSIFYCLEKKGVLKAKEKKTVEVYFKPKIEGSYEQRIKFFTKRAHKISVEIQLSGSAIAPRVVFNKNNVILSPVPLNTEARGIVQLNNEGYQTLTFTKWKINHQYPSIALNINFIDGRTISLAKKKIRIEVTFKSQIPASFTTGLELCDEYGQKISIPISCTAENCLFTIYNFLDYQETKKIVFDNLENVIKVLVNNNVTHFDKEISVSGGLSAACIFIKKWCNFQLNIELSEFPQSLIESRGIKLYQLIYRMTNGRTSLKKPVYVSEDKTTKMRQNYQFYCEVIASLENDGAFLNHIRPEFLLNMNDYLLFLVNENLTIETQETVFEILSIESWITLFYQMYKIYIQSHISEKFIAKLVKQTKTEKMPLSTLYSPPQIQVLQYINSYLGDEKIYNFGQQSKIFEAIQKILERTFGICLSDQLSNLKLNTTSMPFHDFMIVLSKFVHHHLQQFGLAMFISPIDFFTMGPKQFLVFFISFMNHLLPYQSLQLINFETATSQKTKKTIELENPSKNKSCRYWVKIFGSDNFQPEFKEIELSPKQKTTIKIQYHCKGVENQEARMILVPIQNEEGYIPSHSLSFLLRNSVYSKTTVRKIKVKASLYQIKTISLGVDLPIENSHQTDFIVKAAEHIYRSCEEPGSQSFYLLNSGVRILKDGKDKCQIKLCPLSIGTKYCEISYVSANNSEYIFEIMAEVGYPNIIQQITLPSLTAEKQQLIKIKVNRDNQLYDNALKFHKQMLQKTKENSNKRGDFLATINKLKASKVKRKMMYHAHFENQNYLTLTKQMCIFDSSEEENDTLEMVAKFPRPHKQFSTCLILESQNKKDIRRYELLAHVSIKPKIVTLKSCIKAREISSIVLSNKIENSFFNVDKKLEQLKIDIIEGTNDLIAVFSPQWLMKDEVKVVVESRDNFQVCIYKLKLEAIKPDCVSELRLGTSQNFDTKFEIDLAPYGVSIDQYEKISFKTDLLRAHSLIISKENKKIQGLIKAGEEQGIFGVKVYLPKRQGYFQYKLNIKNIEIKELPEIYFEQKIFEIKKITIPHIQIDPSSFEIIYAPQFWFSHVLQNKAETNKKEYSSLKSLNFIFKPTKQIEEKKKIHFKSKDKQYVLWTKFHVQPLEPIMVPMLKSKNVEENKTTILVVNNYEAQGRYQIQMKDSKHFRCDKSFIDIKHKDKIPLKISYFPEFIGEIIKSNIILHSKNLPNLTYSIEGVSIFETEREQVQIECYDNSQINHSFYFINNFPQKQKFKFQIEEEIESNMMIVGRGAKSKSISEQIQSKKQFDFQIFRQKSGSSPSTSKLSIYKGFDRKLIKEITIRFLIIRDLSDSDYHWECQAREMIYETIRLPDKFLLKDIKSDPEIRKCISYNGEEQVSDQIRLKFTSLKPIKQKKVSIILITNSYKFRVNCVIRVTQPPIDDTIMIRTDQIKQVKTAVFRLTNTTREPAVYHAYFLNEYQQFEVEPAQGILEPYGKTGTPICIKFSSEIHNKRSQDKLYIETESMLWIFRVIGIQSKILKF